MSAIAIVGIGCRYPDATGPDELWDTVLHGRRAFRALPAERLGSGYLGDGPDHTYLTHAAVLRGWEFDRGRFRVPGAGYRAADPTHWLALETSADALADAGFPAAEGLDRESTGVIFGNTLTGEVSRTSMLRLRWPYLRSAIGSVLARRLPEAELASVLAEVERGVKEPFPEPGDESLSGALANTIAGRVCNHFDLHGAGYTVDGACASSLLAVATACRALRSGELSFALAGGVDLSLDPFELVGFARLGALARGDAMRVYDASPTGFLPGEGCGVLALMRASDAEALGVRAYALILGEGISSDGSGGLTRPEIEGQARALRRAYAAADVEASDVTLIEGHGTGTPVGDPVEIEALRSVRGAAPGVIGSIKANLGHTKAAAGAAGLIKAALAVHHRVLPPVTGCETRHPSLDSLRTPRDPEPWTGPPLAGISSMGFGGINTHVVITTPRSTNWGKDFVGEPAGGARKILHGHRDGVVRGDSGPAPGAASRRPARYDIVPVAAAGRTELAARLTELAGMAERLSEAELHDLAATCAADFTKAATRTPGEVRAVLVASSPAELARAARAAAAQVTTERATDAQVAAERATAQATTAQTAAERAAAERAAAGAGHGRIAIGAGYALGEGAPVSVGLLFPGQAAPVRARLRGGPECALVPDSPVPITDGATATEIAQPAVVRQSLAGLAWLAELGCEPVAASGHSLGEITALAWAGALTWKDALHLATARGAAMALHGLSGTTMANLACTPEEARRLGAGDGPVIAAYNAPGQTVIAGTEAEVEAVVKAAGASGVSAVRLSVSHAFHSPAMADVAEPLREVLAGMAFDAPTRPVISTVAGKHLRDHELAEESLRNLLVEQLTAPVRFVQALEAVDAELLVEAGPGTILSGLASRAGRTAVSLDCGGDERTFALATAALVAGGAADLTPWFAGRADRELRPGMPLGFLTNPCETIPQASIPPATLGAATLPQAAFPQGAFPQADPAALPERGAADSDVGEAIPIVAGSASGSALELLREHLAALVELPLEAVPPEASLLGDLHLNSLQAARVVTAVARALGRRSPEAPLSLATATVAESAKLIEALPAGGKDKTEVPGIAPWVRAFTHEQVSCEAPGAPAPRAPDASGVSGASGTSGASGASGLHDAPDAPGPHDASHRPDVRDGASATVIELRRDAAGERIAALLRDLAATPPDRLLVVHDGHPAAAALARSSAVETPVTGVTVLEVPPGAPLPTAPVGPGYTELRRSAGPASCLTRTRTRLYEPGPGEDVLGPGDVCLVTGGVTGITAYAAAAYAQRTGARLVALGRTPEAELPDDRPDAIYVRCDVTDPEAVRTALATARSYGPVRGLVHGAGLNRPQAMSQVSEGSLATHLAPKVDGLTNLLRETGDLRLLVAFGSIIGRRGLAGQSEYAIANDTMRRLVEDWAAEHPRCRTRLLEWSVWSAIGMGVRLEALDALRRQGVQPIAPDDGVDLFLQVVADPEAPVTLLLTARFPAGPTLRVESGESAYGRFTEHVHTRTPGVETVTGARLTRATDPYLDDHHISGVPVLPAVLGLEAMAQTAALTTGPREVWSFTDVRLTAPVTGENIQVAALAADDTVRLALRSDGTECFTARLTPPPAGPAPDNEPAREMVADARGWYGPLFFHGPSFQRVRGYTELTAFRVRAELTPADVTWFSRFHPQELLLGDPGLADAALHALLACVPHRRALPSGADRYTVWRPYAGRCVLTARERSHTADSYVFDVDVTGEDGLPIARWEGLELRALDTTPPSRDTAPREVALVGPWLTRRLIELAIADDVELAVHKGERGTGSRRPTPGVSRSYTAGHALTARAATPVGVDWQLVDDGEWVLDACDRDLAESLLAATPPAGTSAAGISGTAMAGVSAEAIARARVWAAREALVKAGSTARPTPREVTPDGLVLLGDADTTVLTAAPSTDAGPIAVAIAVLAERSVPGGR